MRYLFAPTPSACLHVLFWALPFLLAGCGGSDQLDLSRSTQSGQVQGQIVGSTIQFLGIPFAAPPVGPLRWRPPAPPASWPGTRPATSYGNACPQFQQPGSEDCLTLNVFAPATAQPGSDLPVMVFIYGGAFVAGQSSMYDPSTLVTNGNIVAVTFNYRIGYLGFLAHPALSANDPNHVSGNYGILDQQAALNWVRDNIAHFGGDPNQVTVFGQSAGGASVIAQLIVAHPVPLKAAIIESGAFLTNYPTLAAAQSAGEQAAIALGCPDQSLSCLQGLPASTLANALNPIAELTTGNGLTVTPVIDAINLPNGPAVAFSSGNFERIPIINGSTHDEWRLFIGIGRFVGIPPLTASGYVADVQGAYGANAANVLAHYPAGSYAIPDYAWAAVITDTTFACNAHLLSAQMSPYTSVYEYELNDPNGPESLGPQIPGFTYGSAHGSELSYLFPTVYAPVLSLGPATLTPAQQELAGTVQEFWFNFGPNGYPAAQFSLPWPNFTNANPQVLSLVPPGSSTGTHFISDHQCAFWAPQLLQAAGLPPDAPY